MPGVLQISIINDKRRGDKSQDQQGVYIPWYNKMFVWTILVY